MSAKFASSKWRCYEKSSDPDNNRPDKLDYPGIVAGLCASLVREVIISLHGDVLSAIETALTSRCNVVVAKWFDEVMRKLDFAPSHVTLGQLSFLDR